MPIDRKKVSKIKFEKYRDMRWSSIGRIYLNQGAYDKIFNSLSNDSIKKLVEKLYAQGLDFSHLSLVAMLKIFENYAQFSNNADENMVTNGHFEIKDAVTSVSVIPNEDEYKEEYDENLYIGYKEICKGFHFDSINEEVDFNADPNFFETILEYNGEGYEIRRVARDFWAVGSNRIDNISRLIEHPRTIIETREKNGYIVKIQVFENDELTEEKRELITNLYKRELECFNCEIDSLEVSEDEIIRVFDAILHPVIKNGLKDVGSLYEEEKQKHK